MRAEIRIREDGDVAISLESQTDLEMDALQRLEQQNAERGLCSKGSGSRHGTHGIVARTFHIGPGEGTRLDRRLAAAEAIIKLLADSPAPLSSAGSHICCAFCNIFVPLERSSTGVTYRLSVEQHVHDCPYRMAHEYERAKGAAA